MLTEDIIAQFSMSRPVDVLSSPSYASASTTDTHSHIGDAPPSLTSTHSDTNPDSDDDGEDDNDNLTAHNGVTATQPGPIGPPETEALERRIPHQFRTPAVNQLLNARNHNDRETFLALARLGEAALKFYSQLSLFNTDSLNGRKHFCKAKR